MAAKPPLPPRGPSNQSNSEVLFLGRPGEHTGPKRPRLLSPSPSALINSPYPGGLHDPRSSSSQSLRPVESVGEGRRTLLLIYIHGFLGDETSFKSFPAHVHGLLARELAPSHVVYTKIYPQYKSRKEISFAKNDFSKWLAPHESPTTDVVLVGHSLGGILGAEVVLMPSEIPDSESPFKHRILGLVAFDTPFLGMHPGVVGTGIASLFRPPPELQDAPLPQPAPFSDWSAETPDPTYNPTYPNDTPLADRKGKLQRAWYFWNKHAGELTKAASDYVSSHLEFGGCLADYVGLRKRYNAIRALEDVEESSTSQSTRIDGHSMKRVRFVNYYSASTGPIQVRSIDSQQQAPQQPSQGDVLPPPALEESTGSTTPTTLVPSSYSSPRLSLEEYRDGEIVSKDLATLNLDADATNLSPQVSSSSSTAVSSSKTEDGMGGAYEEFAMALEMLPLPDLPPQPLEFDPTQHRDEDLLKLARSEHERAVKAYESALKDRQKSIREREKLLQKRQRQAAKQMEKAQNARLKQQSLVQPHKTLGPADAPNATSMQALQDAETGQGTSTAEKKPRDRRFCVIPSKDRRTGQVDPTWIRVYMEGIDEVVAHTSMFKMGETYVKMVHDLVQRIEGWVQEDQPARTSLGGDAP